MKNEFEINLVPEQIADTRRIAEIRFDAIVTMHDVGHRVYKGTWGQTEQSKKPQWFKAQTQLTLEFVKYEDPYVIGQQIKQMFLTLDNEIRKYEFNNE